MTCYTGYSSLRRARGSSRFGTIIYKTQETSNVPIVVTVPDPNGAISDMRPLEGTFEGSGGIGATGPSLVTGYKNKTQFYITYITLYIALLGTRVILSAPLSLNA